VQVHFVLALRNALRYTLLVSNKQQSANNMYKLQHSVTANTQAQAQAMLAQMQHTFKHYTLKRVQYSNDLYAVTLLRKFNSYSKAVQHFNSTVQQFCNIAAAHVDDEDHTPSCYVINAEGHAVY
jgi:hypothetical protein